MAKSPFSSAARDFYLVHIHTFMCTGVMCHYSVWICLCHENPQLDNALDGPQFCLFPSLVFLFPCCSFCRWKSVLCACLRGTRRERFMIPALQIVSRALKWNTCLLFLGVTDTQLEHFLGSSGSPAVTLRQSLPFRDFTRQHFLVGFFGLVISFPALPMPRL